MNRPSALLVEGDAAQLCQVHDDLLGAGLHVNPGSADLALRLNSERDAVRALVSLFGRTAGVNGEHVQRVERHAGQIGVALGLNAHTLEHLSWGAFLHDVGKSRLPRSLLSKPGALSEQERQLLQQHPQWGAQMLQELTFLPWAVFEVVLAHHERWDGAGYPFGLSGTDIPLLARIVTVCDVYEALLSERPYRPAVPRELALRKLVEQRGQMFDPEVLDVFVHHVLPAQDAERSATGSP